MKNYYNREDFERLFIHYNGEPHHSVVSTCKLQGYSILEYLKEFFAEITAGNRDYGKLMPSTITGIYVVIRGEMNQNIVLYKYITAVDKTYARSSFLFFKDNDMFKRQKENLLRISPVIHMIMVENEILLLDIKKLENSLRLKDILVRKAERDIQAVMDKRLVTDNQFLKKACGKTSMCKKLRHALTQSKVVLNGIDNTRIISFAKSKQEKLKFHFNAAKDAFDIKSKAEAERFIKLRDDDFLRSELTQEDYDSYDKESLK